MRIIKKRKALAQDNLCRRELLQALKSSIWINPAVHDKNYECFYQILSSLKLGNNAECADVVVIDNLENSVRGEVTLRGIVIITQLCDEADIDMAWLEEYVDFIYLAIPVTTNMSEVAATTRQVEWGVLTVTNSGRIQVIRSPTRLHPTNRERTLSEICSRFATRNELV